MSQKRFSIGPGAASLIMIIVVLSTSALGILALMNARHDLSLSRRSVMVAEDIYDLNERAENTLARLDSVLATAAAQAGTMEIYLDGIEKMLPVGMTLDGRQVKWEERSDDGRVLYCIAALAEWGQKPRVTWKAHELAAEAIEMEMDERWN